MVSDPQIPAALVSGEAVLKPPLASAPVTAEDQIDAILDPSRRGPVDVQPALRVFALEVQAIRAVLRGLLLALGTLPEGEDSNSLLDASDRLAGLLERRMAIGKAVQ